MKAKELLKLGVPPGYGGLATRCFGRLMSYGMSKNESVNIICKVLDRPSDYLNHELAGDFAHAVSSSWQEREELAPFKIWGTNIEKSTIEQMENACRLPIAYRGALMPDAHLGYGLPVGGVLATEGAVLPFCVGVDIACRMKATIIDIPVNEFDRNKERFKNAINRETSFGMGANFKKPKWHSVMDENWDITKTTSKLKDKARTQLGTSGGGNHFVEFGIALILDDNPLGLEPGEYIAILSHSGSRGAGATIANHYTKLAMALHIRLPSELRYLAWLNLDSEPGQEYWESMQLMGKYAEANHHVIHRDILKNLGCQSIVQIENHHNFAWKEEHDGKDVIVHRKGATPAEKGVLGIIPGNMVDPAYIVSGLGDEESLKSAAHGAGRLMSRKKARNSFNKSEYLKKLSDAGVTVLSAGTDESPHAYKNIHRVMLDQKNLVKTFGKFYPKIVKMAPDKPKRRKRY